MVPRLVRGSSSALSSVPAVAAASSSTADRTMVRRASPESGGHNPLPWPTVDETPGPPCYCGKNGCLETWISGTGLMRDFFHHTQRPLDGPGDRRRQRGR